MCGRTCLSLEASQIEQETGRKWMQEPAYNPSYNVKPTQTQPIILSSGIVNMKWGFNGQNLVINRRSDKIINNTKNKHRRCIAIAQGYYEWKQKQPYYFYSDNLLYFAALFQNEKDGNHYAIITTDASKELQEIHDRMPAILDKNQLEQWLNPETDFKLVAAMLKPRENIKFHTVSDRINSIRSEGSKLVQKFTIPRADTFFKVKSEIGSELDNPLKPLKRKAEKDDGDKQIKPLESPRKKKYISETFKKLFKTKMN